MKKLIIATALILSAGFAAASDVGVSTLRDYAVEKNGVRVETSVGKLGALTPKLSFTHVDGSYNRYGFGTDINVFEYKNVTLSANVGGVYQDTSYGANGYGLVTGVKASVDLTKYVSANIGVDRFTGQSRVSSFDGNTTTLGVVLKF
jgi:hypothetical protein